MAQTYGNLVNLPIAGDLVYGGNLTTALQTMYSHHASNTAPWANATVATTTANSTAIPGALWYDTSAGSLRIYNGTTKLWTAIGGAATIADAAPSTPNDGDMWYDSLNNYRLFIWSATAAAWVDASPAAANTTTMSTGKVTATAGQTVFTATALSVSFVSGATIVYLNGIKLEAADYTIDYSAQTITLTTAAAVSDDLSVIVFKPFAIADAAPLAAPTFTGLVKGTVTTETNLTLDMSVNTNYIVRTPTAADTLTFTNAVSGSSGFLLLINTGGWAISKGANVACDTSLISTISTAGTYLISYFCYGTTAYLVTSGALV
jgi:hypothetical protein